MSAAAGELRRAGFGLAWLRRKVEIRRPAGLARLTSLGVLPYTDDLESFLVGILAAGETSGIQPITPELLLLTLLVRPDDEIRHIFSQRRMRLWWLRRRLRALTRNKTAAQSTGFFAP